MAGNMKKINTPDDDFVFFQNGTVEHYHTKVVYGKKPNNIQVRCRIDKCVYGCASW